MRSRFPVAIAFALSLLAAGTQGADVRPHRTTAAVGGAETQAHGQVRALDRAAGRVLLEHGPIANLGMGAMTMEFRVRDPALLAQLREGDKVSFVAEQVADEYYVTKLDKVR